MGDLNSWNVSVFDVYFLFIFDSRAKIVGEILLL